MVSFPEWGIRRIRAKADTGARGSVIDVATVEELPDNKVRFTVRLKRNRPEETLSVTAPILRRTRVRSSNGLTSERLVVQTTLKVGSVEKQIEISLACRKKMLCRVLLGRTALGGTFLVDPTEKHLHSPRKGKKTTR